MYIRRVKTSSGATAVQIAQKRHGKREILEHLGSAHDEVTLAALEQVAREKIQAGQMAFDLDLYTDDTTEYSLHWGPPVLSVGASGRICRWRALEPPVACVGATLLMRDLSTPIAQATTLARPRNRELTLPGKVPELRRVTRSVSSPPSFGADRGVSTTPRTLGGR